MKQLLQKGDIIHTKTSEKVVFKEFIKFHGATIGIKDINNKTYKLSEFI